MDKTISRIEKETQDAIEKWYKAEVGSAEECFYEGVITGISKALQIVIEKRNEQA